MQGMLRRDLKSLQLLAHPNIVRVMAVVTDAASQPVGFIMEPSPPPGRRHAMQHMTLPHVRVLVTLCCCLLRAARVRQVPHVQVPLLCFGSSASALGGALRRARRARLPPPLQEREPGGEDGEGRGG